MWGAEVGTFERANRLMEQNVQQLLTKLATGHGRSRSCYRTRLSIGVFRDNQTSPTAALSSGGGYGALDLR